MPSSPAGKRKSKEPPAAPAKDLLEMATEDGANQEFRYIKGVSIAGMFYLSGGEPRFLPLHREAIKQPIFPKKCTRICSSSSGLLLCYPCTVFNPFIPDTVVNIPSPLMEHKEDDPRALIAYTDPHLGLVYHVVCAVRRAQDQIYTFDVYSSNTRMWRYGTSGIIHENICEHTGISSNRRAYWLAAKDLTYGYVVYYDVFDNKQGSFDLPPRFGKDEDPYGFLDRYLQLGLPSGKVLLLLMGGREDLEVYALNNENQWQPPYCLQFRPRKIFFEPWVPFPLRSQSRKLQAVFGIEGGVLVLESAASGKNSRQHPRPPCLRLVRIQGLPMEQLMVHDFLPHIVTGLRPQDALPQSSS